MRLRRRAKQGAGAGRSARGVLALVAVGTLFGAAGVAGWDMARRADAAREQAEASLLHAATVVDALHHAEDRAVADALEQLRTALRAQALWSRASLDGEASKSPDAASEATADRVDSEAEAAVAARDEGDPQGEDVGVGVGAEDASSGRSGPPTGAAATGVERRRLIATLRRALAESDVFRGLELVTAGHRGLGALALARDGERAHVVSWDDETRARMAKALWYADEVKQAVAASGRRIERGDIGFEGDPERPLARVVIALHAPGELVQGALVGLVDLGQRGQRLQALVPDGTDFAWLSLEGRSLDPTVRSPEATARLAAFATEALTGEGATAIRSTEGALVLARPLALADDGPAQSVGLFEITEPATGLAALLATPWPWVLSAHALCVLVALLSIARVGAGALAVASATTGADARVAADPADETSRAVDEITPRREAVVLRDWLADVRGCLEREAATRGLGFDLRCARALGETVETDPGWLGGLLVAMGREALDATAEPAVRVAVTADEPDAVCFEVDAGDVALAPVAGMREVAAAIGGRFETKGSGRLALVVPGLRA